MNRENVTGIAGIVIGAGIAVAALALPWELPSGLRHVLFWLGSFAIVVGILWLIHVHYLNRYTRPIYYGIPSTIIVILLIVSVVVEWPTDDTRPGISVYSVMRLYDSPEYRRRYVFEFDTSDGAKAVFFLSASGQFTFSITDLQGEIYPIEVKVGRFGIPIDEFVVLFCEAGVGKTSTVLRVLVNQKEIARREIPTAIDLGKRDWHAGSIGAPVIGVNQGGIFLLAEIAVTKSSLGATTIKKLVENASKFYGVAFD